MSASPFAADRAGFWRELCPELSVEGTSAHPTFEIGNTTEAVRTLKREGYVNVPSVLPEAFMAPLRACIALLHEEEIPLAFAFVYDEFWHAFQGLSGLIGAALGGGYRALPDFWVWHVLPDERATGWGPHRDRTRSTLDGDNSPHSLTVWLPFTDSTPLNGCIYVLPAHRDPCFSERRWDGQGSARVKDLQDIRALPATAGSVLAWNQAILHWGGRGSALAEGPRSSAALEFQRGSLAPFNTPLLDPQRRPSFQERLGLVGKQVLQYRHMYPLSAGIAAMAQGLCDRFMPEVQSAEPTRR